MHKIVVGGGLVVLAGIALWLAFAAPQASAPSVPSPQTQGCTQEAKVCPDGSSVGRTGPNCEFAPCPAPAPAATKATITTRLGGQATGLGLTINPRELVSDSRCAEGVQCVWAGTVEVRAAVSTTIAHGELVFTLGEPRTVGDFSVTLVDVTPAPKAGEQIPTSSYRFVFEVTRR